MNLEQSYQKENRCYRRAVRMEVTRITLYYEVISRKEVAELLREWNSEQAKIGIHAIIIGDKIIQTLPWDYKGRVRKDRMDDGSIGILIADSEYEVDQESVYDNTVELCALLCKQYHLNPTVAVRSPDRELEELPEAIQECMRDVTFNRKKPYEVMVTASHLNIRMGPSVDTRIIGTVKNGEVYLISEQRDNWGRLNGRRGYISLAYTKRI